MYDVDDLKYEVEHLDLSNQKLKELPEDILKYKKVIEINLSNNEFVEFPIQVFQISTLEGLRLDNNNIEKVANFSQILSLKIKGISLMKNKMREFPSSFSQLHSLQTLILSDNKIREIPKSISGFRAIKTLDLSGNEISFLPYSIKEIASTLIKFNIEDNKIEIPREILSRPPKQIISFIFDLQDESIKTPLREAKLIFIGSGEVGKTSIINRLVFAKFNPKETKTDGIDIHSWKRTVNGKTIKLNVWDFGGQEIMHATHRFFMTSRSIYIIAINARTDDKFGERDLEYWLSLIKSYAGSNVPIVIVINKVDIHDMDIGEVTLKTKYENIVGVVRTSCVKNIGFDDLNRKIIYCIDKLNYLDDPIPLSYHEIKERLSKINRDYIQYREYEEICEDIKPTISPDSKETLVGLLHDLGVMLNFSTQRKIGDTQVLNPEWVTKGVYQIINSKIVKERKGIISENTIAEILDPALYRTMKERNYIINMMEHFELCFTVNKSKNEIAIPGSFPVDMPDNKIYTKVISESRLKFIFRYKPLPTSIISRLIVHMNRHILEKKYWRKGLILSWENCNALIYTDSIDEELRIYISGAGNVRMFFALIKDTIETINDSMGGIEVEQLIPIDKNNEIFIPYSDLLEYEKAGYYDPYIPSIKAKIDIKGLLEGYNLVDNDYKKLLKDIISKGSLMDALKILRDKYSANNDIVLLISELNNIEKESIIGKNDFLQLSKNRIIRTTLELIDSLP